MGASGPGLFSDDVACDARSDYREFLEDGIDDREALARVLDRHLESLLDADDEVIVVVALAVTASKLGRLPPDLRERAVEMIDAGRGLRAWEVDAGLLRRRVAALAKAREQLVGPQPARRAVRRRRRRVPSVARGDILAVETAPGRYRVVRVARLKETRSRVAPVIQILDWVGASPVTTDFASCGDMPEPLYVGAAGVPRAHATRRTMLDMDTPADAGFVAVGSLADTRAGDDSDRNAESGGTWSSLARLLRALDAAS